VTDVIYFNATATTGLDHGWYVADAREAVLAGPYPTARAAEYAARGGSSGPTWRPARRAPSPAPTKKTKPPRAR
jgi:hypothetical protein